MLKKRRIYAARLDLIQCKFIRILPDSCGLWRRKKRNSAARKMYYRNGKYALVKKLFVFGGRIFFRHEV